MLDDPNQPTISELIPAVLREISAGVAAAQSAGVACRLPNVVTFRTLAAAGVPSVEFSVELLKGSQPEP